MSDPESFIDTLKRIGFPDVHKYKPDDFVSIFADENLKPVLETVCTLTENNVLSADELAEYASIQPGELAHFEKLAQRAEAFATSISEDESREEVQYLERHLSHIEEHNKALQKQKELLKSHLNSLGEERDKCKEALVDAKRKFETYTMQKLPQAQAELVSVLQSICQLLLELQKLISEPEYNADTPSLNLKGVESYLDQEKQLLNYIQGLLSKDLQVEDFKNHIQTLTGHKESKLLREIKFLQTVLKNSKIDELQACSEREKMSKIVDFYKKCEGVMPPNISEISTSVLWTRLGEESNCNEKLIAKEKLVSLYLSAAVADRVDAQCSKIGTAHSEESLHIYNSHLEKIQEPLDKVLGHSSRIQLVLLYLGAYAKKFQNIQQLAEQASEFIQEEKETLSERKHQFENELEKETPKKDKYLPEDSVFLSIFKILRGIDGQQNLSSVTMDDVWQRVEKMQKEKEFLEKLQDKKLSVLHSLEDQRCALEKLVFQGKEFANLSELDMNFNARLNRTGITHTSVKKAILEVEKFMNTKQKLIDNDNKLRLARCLYLYALCNEQEFKSSIENIKISAENCTDSVST